MKSHADRQARYRQRQKARIAELEKQAQPRNVALESELARARARNVALENALKRAQAAAPPKTSRPPRAPLDPDRQLARALTANKNLRSKNAYLVREYDEKEKRLREKEKRLRKMLDDLHHALAKCLHADTRARATDADKEHAMRLLNDFRSQTR